MPILYDQFVHPSDVKAQHALERIPGFKKLAKELMTIWHERQCFIENMSGNIKLGTNQMPEIYGLLPPICEKLGIDIPDMYVTLDREVNAYTLGDTEPIIMLTSGLLETLSKEEIQIVIAHECGHILCHHTLYKMMARMIINTSSIFLSGLIGTLSLPLVAALKYWDRCSEFSADRVSAFFAGGSNKVSDVMFRLAGATHNLGLSVSKEEFLKQAGEYKDYIDSSKINKGMELYMYALSNSHPLLAYRAYEITSWCNSESFFNIDPTIIVDVPENSKELNIEQFVIDKVEARHISDWFKKHNPTNEHTNLVIHCGICKKSFPCFKKLSFNSNKTIYQAVVDSKGNVIKYRLILFSTMDEHLRELFIKHQGYIIIK